MTPLRKYNPVLRNAHHALGLRLTDVEFEDLKSLAASLGRSLSWTALEAYQLGFAILERGEVLEHVLKRTRLDGDPSGLYVTKCSCGELADRALSLSAGSDWHHEHLGKVVTP